MLERELLKIPNEDLYDETKYFGNDGRYVKSLPYITPVTLFNPVDRDTPQFMNGNSLKVSEDVDVENSGIIVAADVQIIVPADENWLIMGIQADGIADLNAAARTPTLQVQNVLQTPVVNSLYALESNAIAQAAGEDFQFMFAPWTYGYWAIDDGVIAFIANLNPLPLPVLGGCAINLINAAANWQLGDNMALSVRYRLWEA